MPYFSDFSLLFVYLEHVGVQVESWGGEDEGVREE